MIHTKKWVFLLLASIAVSFAAMAQDDGSTYEDLLPPGEEAFSASGTDAKLDRTFPDKAKVALPGAIAGFGEGEASATWNFVLPETRYYTLVFQIVPGTAQTADRLDIYMDGKALKSVGSPGNGSKTVELSLENVFLKDGSHELTLWKGWKDLRIVGVRVVSGDSFRTHRPDDVPVNPNASPEVRKVMKFLADIKGKHIVAGQMDLTWSSGIDMLKRVEKVTGKLPGLYGFDFLSLMPRQVRDTKDSQVNEAIAWWNRGGLVAFCWHWRQGDSAEFYTKLTDFRINRNPDSDAYKAIVKDIDRVASNLKRLQDAGVPVLWRPMHEASGGWFWWGASGPSEYLWLWNFMYDRLVNYHKLNNLIWVWNGQSADWYPGNETVDVIGLDIYPKAGDHSSQLDKYLEAMSFAQGSVSKIIALTENGTMPDPENLKADGAGWTWFMTWNDAAGNNEQENFWSGNFFTSEAKKKAIYNSDYVLTLDELPSFKE